MPSPAAFSDVSDACSSLACSSGGLLLARSSTLGDEIDSYIAWKKRPVTFRPRTVEYLNPLGGLWGGRTTISTALTTQIDLEDAIVGRATKHALGEERPETPEG